MIGMGFVEKSARGRVASGGALRGFPLFLLAVISAFAPLQAWAQLKSERPRLLRDVGIDQKLDGKIPLDAEFRDSAGKVVRLREYFRSKPVVLTPVYYECPMLCTQVLNGLLQSFRGLSFNIGKEFEVVTFSIDPREKPELAAAKKHMYTGIYARPGAEKGWHFLTGDEASIHALTQAVGFRYAFDPATGQFAHGAAIIVLTPEGKISRYFYGIDYPARDLRLGLVEASRNKIGTLTDQVLLFCYHYDPVTGKYGLLISRIIQAVGLATVAAMGIFMIVMFRSERYTKIDRPPLSGRSA